MVFTDAELLARLEETTALCGTLLGVALDKKGVSDKLRDGTRNKIIENYLGVCDTRDARGIER